MPRPEYIDDLKKKIEELKERRSDLHKSSKGSPKHLQDLKNEFDTNLKENFITHYAKAHFLQSMLQEPPVTVAKELSQQMEESNQQKLDKIDTYTSQIERLKSTIQETEQQITKDSKKCVQLEQVLNDILEKEAEVRKIKSELAGQGKTVEECKAILSQQAIDLANLQKIVDERQERVEDYVWKNHKKEKTIELLRKKTEEKINKAEEIKRLNTERDETTEKKYYIYKNAFNTIKNIAGVESIEYESFSLLKVHCKNATIHIHIDLIKNKITDAYVTGADVKVADILKIVKGIHVTDGLSRLILEIIARLN